MRKIDPNLFEKLKENSVLDKLRSEYLKYIKFFNFNEKYITTKHH